MFIHGFEYLVMVIAFTSSLMMIIQFDGWIYKKYSTHINRKLLFIGEVVLHYVLVEFLIWAYSFVELIILNAV